MSEMYHRPAWDRAAGLVVVLLLHGMAIYALWHYQIRMTPHEAMTIFVNFINPSPPSSNPETSKAKPKPLPPKLPEPVKLVPPPPQPQSRPQQLVVEAPVVSPEEPVAPAPPPEPVIEASPNAPAGPVQLTSELAVTCPDLTPPVYPAQARRLGEQGKVVVYVELNEKGRISAARVETSSGSKRLDEAALAAVKTWRCAPAMRDGVPVRAVALQPFIFKLEER